MKPFDDTLPEEQEHHELTTLLPNAFHNPLPEILRNQEYSLARVQARLAACSATQQIEHDAPEQEELVSPLPATPLYTNGREWPIYY